MVHAKYSYDRFVQPWYDVKNIYITYLRNSQIAAGSIRVARSSNVNKCLSQLSGTFTVHTCLRKISIEPLNSSCTKYKINAASAAFYLYFRCREPRIDMHHHLILLLCAFCHIFPCILAYSGCLH